jgi:hypothetical protein
VDLLDNPTPVVGRSIDVIRSCGRVALASVLLAACLSSSRQESGTSGSTGLFEAGHALKLPGTYSTGRSCGAEWGDEILLTLLPTRVFSLRQTYRDQACVHQVTLIFLGRWAVAADGRHVWLDNGPLWLRRLTIVDHQTLTIPDEQERGPPPRATHRVASSGRLVPFRDPLHLSGLVIQVGRHEGRASRCPPGQSVSRPIARVTADSSCRG